MPVPDTPPPSVPDILPSVPDAPPPSVPDITPSVPDIPLSMPEIPPSVLQVYKSNGPNLHGLIACAIHKMEKSSCTSISVLGVGAYNAVYKLTFSDGSEVAASTPFAAG